jgi:hypothetical protein
MEPKEFEVKVQRGDKISILPIKAGSADIARRMAERLLARKNTKQSRVISTTERSDESQTNQKE